jgi:tetratricopeptide (TPR) repeat protein
VTDFDSLWDYSDPVATEARFRERLPEIEHEGGSRELELLTQIARTQSLQRKFAEAHALLDRVEARLRPDTARARIRYLLERGRTFNSAGDRERARPLFVAAWDDGRHAGEDALAVDAAHMIAIVETGDSALRWNEAALEHAEASSDPRARRWRGSLHNNLGWTRHAMGQFDRALEHFQIALECRRAEADAERIHVGCWCVARCLRSLGRLDESLAMQRNLEHEANADPDGYVLEEIAECLAALGRAGEAAPWFARAYEALSKITVRDGLAAERLERLKTLGAASG